MRMVNDMSSTELLGAISGMLDERFEKNNEKLMQVMNERFEKMYKDTDKRFEEWDKALEKRLEERDRNLMNALLEEIDLVQEKANNHFERIEKRLANLEISFRTRRTDLEYRVAALERKLSC